MKIKMAKSGPGWTKFVPEFNDNKDLPEDQQISGEVHWLSHGEMKRYTEKIKIKRKGKRIVNNSAEVDRKIFTENIRNLKNIEDQDGKPVTEAGELYDHGPTELIDEFVAAIQSYGIHDEDDQKN